MSASEPSSDEVRGRSPRGEVSDASCEPLGFRHPEIQRLRRLLGRRSARHDEGAFVVEGSGLLAEAIAGGWEVETVYLDADADVGAIPATVPVRRLGRGVLARVATTKTPQGTLAVVRVRTAALRGDESLLLVADGIADPGNLGTMLRSAEAAGVEAVVTTAGTVDAMNPKVVRASAGAIFHVPVVAAGLDALRVHGMLLVGTSSHRGVPYHEADWTSAPLAIVMGSEAHGLADDAPIDIWVTIPHHGRAESLNVAMAATLLCFHAAASDRTRSG